MSDSNELVNNGKGFNKPTQAKNGTKSTDEKTGTFNEENIKKIAKYNIVEKLNSLISLIKGSSLVCKNHVGEIILDRPNDPCFFIQYNEHLGIQCILRPSGTDKLVTCIKVMPKANADNYLETLANNTGLVAKGISGQRYTRKDDWKKGVQIGAQQQILFRINDMWDFLQKNAT